MKKIKSSNYRFAAAASGSDIFELFPVALHNSKESWIKYRIIRNEKVFTGHCHGMASKICNQKTGNN
ncbi:MAG TPA: hypothetical protein PLY34_00250 [Ferruginibacter sp.]|nr:hypothetical protein [Ferruginibacter sp.]HPH89336.1 hypothetical protein [Ferruginibacter sp.]